MDDRRRVTRLLGASALAPALLWPQVAYLTVLTAAAWTATRRPHRRAQATDGRVRFTVLIPAHDEERLVGDTVRSLLDDDHPRWLVDVIVVADHCRDRTVEIARAAGAAVWEHDDPEPPGKAAALRWALDRLPAPHDGGAALDPTVDVIVFVDADTVVDPGFFRALGAHLADGARAVQANYTVRDGSGATVELRGAALALRHFVRPLGRVTLGGSCGLFGNGMAFERDVIDAHRWNDHLTEDAELQARLLLDDIPVAFAPDAIVRAVMPDTLAASRTQHERWERGRVQLARHVAPELVRAAVAARGRRRRALADGALDLVVPPLSVLAAATVAGACWSTLAAALSPGRAARLGRRSSAAMVVALAVHVIGGLRIAGATATTYRALAHAPRLVAWKLRLWCRMLVVDEVRWVRTDRGDPATSSPQRAGRRANPEAARG
jgi:hypothetical protein